MFMGYVTRCQYDIFVSYSHKDDPTWITGFERALLQELRKKLGHECVFWRDEENIRLGQNWKDAIKEGIQSTAVFITILSPGYQVSEWCARERKCFLDQFSRTEEMKVTLKAGSAYRFLKIVKAPWEDDEQREFFNEVQDMEFFLRDAAGIDRELVPGTDAFRARLEEAAHHTAAILKAMRRVGETVFVATPTEDTFRCLRGSSERTAGSGLRCPARGASR
jgi:TIR domain